MPSKKSDKLEVGDLITWVDENDLRKYAAIMARLSTQLLVIDTTGVERVVRMDERSLELARDWRDTDANRNR